MVAHIVVVHYKNVRPCLHFLQSKAEIFIGSMQTNYKFILRPVNVDVAVLDAIVDGESN